MFTRDFPYFFAPEHAAVEARAAAFAAGGTIAERVAALGQAGLLERRDTRSLAVTRRQLAYRDPLTDLACVIQELACTPLELAAELPAVAADARAGRRVLAFALTEPGAGSDVRALATTATRDGASWRLTGTKHFISNAPDCDGAVVFARAPDGVAAFFVERPPAEAQRVASHSIGRLVLADTPATLVSPRGLALAFGTLERCRPTVGAAAVGLAARALDETVAHLRRREQFGAPLAQLPVVQLRVAEMKNDHDVAALATLHAAWTRDHAGGARVGPVMAFGKVVATEAAQRVIDQAVQLHGGAGVEEGSTVEALYRAVRPLRIYEGATDVLLNVIGQHGVGG